MERAQSVIRAGLRLSPEDGVVFTFTAREVGSWQFSRLSKFHEENGKDLERGAHQAQLEIPLTLPYDSVDDSVEPIFESVSSYWKKPLPQNGRNDCYQHSIEESFIRL